MHDPLHDSIPFARLHGARDGPIGSAAACRRACHVSRAHVNLLPVLRERCADGVELTAAAVRARQDALKLACIDLAEALDVEIAEAFYSLSKGRAYYEMTNEQIARVRIREKEVVVGLCSERCAGQIIKHGACHSSYTPPRASSARQLLRAVKASAAALTPCSSFPSLDA